jgi:phage baseplate assembly protein gpV
VLARAKRLSPVLAASLAALGFASAANASVTVGQLFTPSGCSTGGTALQTGVASGNSYTVPSPGVITSWSFDDGAAIVPDLELKVARRVTGHSYSIVGTSVAGTQTPNTVSTYPTHISVSAGDVIGEFENGGDCGADGTTSDTYEWITTTNEPLGATATFMPLAQILFPVSASVEPDADSDGFGDETQDKCPTNSSTQGPCPPPPPPAPDTRRPSVSSSGTNAKLSSGGSISFSMTADEAATGNATGTISVPTTAKTVRFKSTKVTLAAGKLTRIALKLSKRNAKAVRKALRHHNLKAKITVRVKDAAGNQTIKKLAVTLKR